MSIFIPKNPQLKKLFKNDVVALAQEKVGKSPVSDPGGYISEAMYRYSVEPKSTNNGSATGTMFERATLSAMTACGIDMMKVQRKWVPDKVKDASISLRVSTDPIFYIDLTVSYRERWRKTDREFLVCKVYDRSPSRYVTIFYCENPEKDRTKGTAIKLAENLRPKFLLEEVEIYTVLDGDSIKKLFREIRDAQLQRSDWQQLRPDRRSGSDLFQKW